MTFLDDYTHPHKKGTWKYGLTLLFGVGLIGSYNLFKDEEKVNNVRSENIRVLEDFAEEYKNHTKGMVIDSDENFDILGNWRSLPNQDRSEILKLMIKEESSNSFYRLRDTAENNLDKITMFLLGGGS